MPCSGAGKRWGLRRAAPCRKRRLAASAASPPAAAALRSRAAGRTMPALASAAAASAAPLLTAAAERQHRAALRACAATTWAPVPPLQQCRPARARGVAPAPCMLGPSSCYCTGALELTTKPAAVAAMRAWIDTAHEITGENWRCATSSSRRAQRSSAAVLALLLV